MNVKDRLRHLAHMSAKDTRLGRTEGLCVVAKHVNGVVVTSSHEHATALQRKYGVTARSYDMNLEGFHGPFFFDHGALEEILKKAANKIESLEIDLAFAERKIERLEKPTDDEPERSGAI